MDFRFGTRPGLQRTSVHLYLIIAVILLGVFASKVRAQEMTVNCLSPSSPACQDSIQPESDLQYQQVAVRVMQNGHPVARALVRLRATSGTVTPDSVFTDTDGVAKSGWTREQGSTPVAVTIAAVGSNGSAVKVLTLTPRATADKPKLVLENWTHTESWFEKNQLPGPVRVAVKKVVSDTTSVHIIDRETCRRQRVAFSGTARVGTASPDTITAELYSIRHGRPRREDNNTNNRAVQLLSLHPSPKDSVGCFAFTNWTFGENPGERELRAKIVPGKGFDAPLSLGIKGNARALPRFIAGFARSPNKGYLGLKKGAARQIHVEHLLSDGSKEIYDSTVTAANSVDTVRAQHTVNVIAGVSIALPVWRLGPFDRLSFTGGVDLASPRDDFYVGGSVARLFGSSVEALPIDLHALLHYGRQPVLEDPSGCMASGRCSTKNKMRYQGVALMLSADATSLISEVIKRLVP
jgi:hypothetical protein